MTADPVDRHLVDLLEAVWRSVADACAGLDEAGWKTPTDCPGWSVQDNVAHLVGIESTLLERPLPDVELADPLPLHVRDDIGRMNEQWVAHYRPSPGEDVLAEFEAVAAERLATLRALDGDGFGAPSFTPVGPGTVRELLPFRIYDSWVHEQDVRRALGRPGDLDTEVGRYCLARTSRPLGRVVGKDVAPPEGTTVVFVVEGPAAFTHALVVRSGRAEVLPEPPSEPTVTLTTDVETFVRVATGRRSGLDALAAGAIRRAGDEALGRSIAAAMNIQRV